MTACPPPKNMDNNVPTNDVKIFKFVFTINQTESINSIRVPMFVFTQPISPCWATEKSSFKFTKVKFFLFVSLEGRASIQ